MIFRCHGIFLKTILYIFFFHFVSLGVLSSSANASSFLREELLPSSNLLAATVDSKKKLNVSSKKKNRKRNEKASIIERRHFIIENSPRYTVHVEYPSVGFIVMDSDIANWARQQVNFFIATLDNIPVDDPTHFILNITYERIQASLRSNSLVFYITTRTDGLNPEQGIVTLSYLVHEGRRLTIDDVFHETKGLATFLSAYTRGKLSFHKMETLDPSRILSGTAPDLVNFLSFAIAENTFRVYFAPNQVAPPSEGAIQIAIPISNLLKFKPNPTLWELASPYATHKK